MRPNTAGVAVAGSRATIRLKCLSTARCAIQLRSRRQRLSGQRSQELPSDRRQSPASLRVPARSAPPRASTSPSFCCWPCCWRWAASSCSGTRAASRVTARRLRCHPLRSGWRRLSLHFSSRSRRSRSRRLRRRNRSRRRRPRSRSCRRRRRTKPRRRRRRMNRRRLLRPARRQARPRANRRQLAPWRLPPPSPPRARHSRAPGTWPWPRRARAHRCDRSP